MTKHTVITDRSTVDNYARNTAVKTSPRFCFV